MKRRVLIIGGGPAGLTAGYELLKRAPGEFEVIILEREPRYLGGISKTFNFKGYRIDIGGHRFFSKSKLVVDWWLSFLPLQGAPPKDDKLLNREPPLISPGGPDPDLEDRVMLVRRRISRILYNGKFFDYPLSLNLKTLKNLGLLKVFKIGITYLLAQAFPRKPERSLEDFFINRFGKELYETFFKEYTEKVWGIPPSEISPEWGAQRVKGLSVGKVLANALRKIFIRDRSLLQKSTETSLIEQFMYPKYGPGQLWELVGEEIERMGGKILKGYRATKVFLDGKKVKRVIAEPTEGGESLSFDVDYLISSMPVRDLFKALEGEVPSDVREVGVNLQYRDFITVGVLLKRLRFKNETKIKTIGDIVPDNWIYVQEPKLKVGRLQIFNNWSPYLVPDLSKVWIGMEYFATRGDQLWSSKDEDLITLGVEELKRIGAIEHDDFLEGVVIRTLDAYPIYHGAYERFHLVRAFTDEISNLFLIGRAGMHRYNNQDHSMLTAIEAVKNILEGRVDKDNIWRVNTEKEYHEELSSEENDSKR